MKVLVTGGTGFLGRSLVRRLVKEGHAVRVLTRDTQAAEGRLPPEAETRTWRSPDPVPVSAFQGVDAVAHSMGENVGRFPWTAERKRAFRISRVEATRALVQSLAALPPESRPRVLVSASAAGWYGDGGDAVKTEADPPGTGFLADLVRDWEAELFRAEASGIRTVALRFGVVLGDGGALEKMRLPFQLGLGAVVGSGRQWFPWLHRGDAAGIFLHALADDSVRGPLNAVAPEQVTNRDFSKALARALHRPLLLKAPGFALSAALGEMARETLLKGQRASADKLLATGYLFRYPTLDAALADILGTGKRK